jgi:oxygen-dependent protoporphyrinogen oxidase
MKRIAIIGGGISGLTVLHYLKQRFGENVEITLFEREALIGGTIHSFKKDSCLFEWGPNGFLDNQPATLQLIDELGLQDQLIEAQKSSKRRYVQLNGQLQQVPTGPLGLIRTPLLTSQDKYSLIKGIFKKKISTDRSIHEYVSQRFSVNIAERLVDPFISGVYAGDIKRLHMASAFPKLKRKGPGKTRMRSFKRGMGQIIEAFDKRYKKSIITGTEVNLAQLKPDITIIATPAYSGAEIVKNINPVLSNILSQIPYAPIAVAGLLFKKDSFKRKPDGFGYLVPSSENKEIVGVLIESNVYAERAREDQLMFRVMLGGMHHPDIINHSQEKILSLAIQEIDHIYGINAQPIEIFVKVWPKAIPQYEINYPHSRQLISEQCAKTPGLYLCANYLDGISLNDCVKNAKGLAENLSQF